MAEKSGFFPYVEGDSNSVYDFDFLSSWIHSLISNGVLNGNLFVSSNNDMTITIPAGQAWINGYYYKNNSDLILRVDNADGVLKRKDNVVLRWDINTRNITAQIIKGTFASNPVAPTLVRNAEQYDLKLAEVYIGAGVTQIDQANITDTRLSSDMCGIVSQAVDHIDTTTFYNQIQGDLKNFKTNNESGFNAWFQSIKGVLDTDTAGHLLNLINNKVVVSTTQPTSQNVGDEWHQTSDSDTSLTIKVKQADGSYVTKNVVSNANLIKTTSGSNVQSHIDDKTVHFTTLGCTKAGTAYALTGLTATSGKVPVMWSVPTAYAAGDTVTIDGTAYTLRTVDGSALTAGAWAAGVVITGVADIDNKVLIVAPSAPVGALPVALANAASIDLNALIAPGRYRCQPVSANYPPGYTADNDFIVHVDNPPTIPANAYVVQTVYDVRSPLIWLHKCVNGIWSWQKPDAGKSDYASNAMPLITPALRNTVIIPQPNSIPTGLPDGTIVMRYTP